MPPSHAQALRQAYAGEAQVLIVPGGTHDSARPPVACARTALFLHRALQREAEGELQGVLARLQALAVVPIAAAAASPRAPQPAARRQESPRRPLTEPQQRALLAALASVPPLSGLDLLYIICTSVNMLVVDNCRTYVLLYIYISHYIYIYVFI